MDLVDPALRTVPVGLRIVKGNKSNPVEAQTVADWHPSHHPTGVISGETNLDEGLYTVIITAEGRNPSRYRYLLRVQMIDYQKLMNSVVLPLFVDCYWAGSDTSSYDRGGCGIDGLASVRRKMGRLARANMGSPFPKMEADNVCAISETRWPALDDIANRHTLGKDKKIPWYIYFFGAAIYTAFAGWLLGESSPLGWFCLISAPVGFFYAWRGWKKGELA